MRDRSYTGLLNFSSFADRFRYLALSGSVGLATFGYERDHNQRFYASYEWRQVRQFVIARDLGCDLGVEGYDIFRPNKVYIHHMNPMTLDDITHSNPQILDPENLITVTHVTHNAIHYGDERQIPRQFEPRRPGDTKDW